MSYTFSATGLPPGLALVGDQILGAPSTPGNYTVTVTVSDGVSSVSETVSMTIAAVPVPVPFWQLILEAESGCYAREGYSLLLRAVAQVGSYWRDSALLVPTLTAQAGSYWRDSAVEAIADTGSYWRDSVFSIPTITVDAGSYWRDSVIGSLSVTAEAGSYWRDSAVEAIADAGSYWFSSVLLDTDFMPYTVITTTTDRQLVANSGYVLDLATTTATVNLLMPLTSGLTAGDRIELYPYKGKAKIKYTSGDTGFLYKGVLVSEIPLDNEAILIGLVWSGSLLGWLPQWKYDLTYTLYTAPPSGVAFTVSTTPYPGTPAATYATLTDGNSTTGATSDFNAPVVFTFPYAVTVTGIKIAGGNVNSSGVTAPNGIAIQYSADGSTGWTTVATTSGTDGSGTLFEFDFTGVSAQYWRAFKSGDYTWFSEFRFLP